MSNHHLQHMLKSTARSLLKQIMIITIALCLSSIFLAISGYDVFAVGKGLIRGITMDFGGTIRWTIPLILTGLAVCVAFRTQVFNLGVDGQLYLGAIAATFIGLKFSHLPSIVGIPLAIFAAGIAGALFAWIPGKLKVLWGTNEVVSTLLLNFVAIYLTDYLVLGPMRGSGSTGNSASSDILPESFWLPRIEALAPSAANYGLYIGIILAVVFVFILYRTKSGFEMKIVGSNPFLANYSGINSKKVIITVMLMSGAIGGLAGAVEVMGVHHRLPGGFNSGLGFDGIVVSLLASNNPIGVLFSAFFFGAIRNGALNMGRVTDIPSSVIDIVQAIIILTVSAQFVFPYIKKFYKPFKWQMKRGVQDGKHTI
ncbi:ABC transporter permease [Bacillus sp. FJAT-50079]|uniref:ABC transporter permease n=1 Tax=Bacillus sp. FJAT-50079 TaxID=2833577 RepID=UPI001BC9ADD7|nr:ABC transporter permease [Bacillus sp. FJAT-50079]MBS4208211.1 ABC transporter permease [Bacillus sp. FJAT-50079]